MRTLSPKTLDGSDFSTYRIGGPLTEAYVPESLEDAIDVLKHVRVSGKPLTVLGWGGNSLIASAGISGITLITRKMDWVKPTESIEHGTHLVFGAGTHMAKMASTALQYGLTGAEFMIGIPGTLGGGVRMNAGALGQEFKDVVERVTLFNLETGEVEVWEPEKLGFSYRKSAIDPARHIVLEGELLFRPGDKAEIKAVMDKNVHFRKTHHPKEPNGGSVFKNPAPGMPMGRLIEELGGKGAWREGGALISPLHGNFIINTGSATSVDVLRLMLRMKRAVQERYGLDTHPENLLLGDTTEEERAIWKELNDVCTHPA